MQNENTRVLIAVPTMGSIHPLLAAQLIKWGNRYGNKVGFYFTQHISPHDRARNNLVEYFLSQESLTHILFIDSDTIPPDHALEHLINHDTPFVTGLTPILSLNKQTHQYEVFDNCFLNTETDDEGRTITRIAQRDTGLQEIRRCGAACMLIKREVFEKLKKPYFRFETNEQGTEHTRSEDIYFCDTLREAGYTLYADTSVYCGHEKRRMM